MAANGHDHHWSASEDALIQQHGGSLTAEELQRTHLPWRTVASVSHRRRLLSRPPKQRERFPLKRFVGTTINGRTVIGISPQRDLIAVCAAGHKVHTKAKKLQASPGCEQCSAAAYITVKQEADGKAPLTPSRWLGKVIHGMTVVCLSDPHRVVVKCSAGHELNGVLPCNVLKACPTCREEQRKAAWVGKKIGDRTVLSVEAGYFIVECSKRHKANVYNPNNGYVCGQCRRESVSGDRWIGHTAGQRTIVGRAEPYADGRRGYTARCARAHEATINSPLELDRVCNQCKQEDAVVHLPEYSVWRGMKSRCENPNSFGYEYYGGRGIQVLFEDFMEFYEHVGPRPSSDYSIDRIDNDGNYEPGNVRWATTKQQARNRSDNHRITFNGVTKAVCEWSEETGIHAALIARRSKQGLPPEEILRKHVPVRDRPLTALGETKTYGEWSDLFDVAVNVIYQRIKVTGWDADKAVTTPVFKGSEIEINGVVKTPREWCDYFGTNYYTACHRVYEWGWDAIRAVSEGGKQHSGALRG